MSENGRAALAERLDGIFPSWAGKTNLDTADELLEGGADFLPDGAKIERLRAAVKLLQDNWPKTIPAPMDRAALGGDQ